MSEAAILGLALLSIDGVGKVTAAKLLQESGTPSALVKLPRSILQVHLTRNAGKIMETLKSEHEMQALLGGARSVYEEYARRKIAIHVPGDRAWPVQLNAVPLAQRPFPLYSFGSMALLKRPLVAFFVAQEAAVPVITAACSLVKHVLTNTFVPVTATSHALDFELQKLCDGRPSVMVSGCGFSKLPRSSRMMVKKVHRAGGLLLSPFPSDHGPFAHDEKERAMTMAGLASASVFLAPAPDSPNWHAMEWARKNRRSVFAWPAQGLDLPAHVHELKSTIDLEWVLAAASGFRGAQ